MYEFSLCGIWRRNVYIQSQGGVIDGDDTAVKQQLKSIITFLGKSAILD